GVAHNPMSDDEFRKRLSEDTQHYAGKDIDSQVWDWFTQRLYYMTGDFDDKNIYSKIKSKLEALDKEHSTHGNYFFSLPTAPTFSASLVEPLATPGMMSEQHHSCRRVIIETPSAPD